MSFGLFFGRSLVQSKQLSDAETKADALQHCRRWYVPALLATLLWLAVHVTYSYYVLR